LLLGDKAAEIAAPGVSKELLERSGFIGGTD